MLQKLHQNRLPQLPMLYILTGNHNIKDTKKSQTNECALNYMVQCLKKKKIDNKSQKLANVFYDMTSLNKGGRLNEN